MHALELVEEIPGRGREAFETRRRKHGFRAMNRTELLERIANRENSRVEFMRDDCHPDELAKEMAALLNLEGGVILLGVEDDGSISGLTRSREAAEKWAMNVARQNLQPTIIPVGTWMELDDGKAVGVIEFAADSPGKPYKARRGRAWTTFTRVGSMSRESTREEEGRLYQAAMRVRYEKMAVPDTGPDDFDMDRVENYYRGVLKRSAPTRADLEGWRRLMLNSDLLVTAGHDVGASVAGVLLFSRNPNRRLPQAGVTAVAFPGLEKEYSTVDEERIRGPLTSRVSRRGAAVDKGVIDRTVDFVKRNMGSVAWLEPEFDTCSYISERNPRVWCGRIKTLRRLGLDIG